MPAVISAVMTPVWVSMTDRGQCKIATVELVQSKYRELPQRMNLHVWIDDNVCEPIVDRVYYVDGKLSYDEDEDLFVIQAIRMVEWNDSIIPLPPLITSSAIVLSKSANFLELSMACYAIGLRSEMKIFCFYNAKQYKTFVDSMVLPCTVHFCGSLSEVQSSKILCLENSQFSFIERPAVPNERKSAPSWWKKKKTEPTSPPKSPVSQAEEKNSLKRITNNTLSNEPITKRGRKKSVQSKTSEVIEDNE